MIVDESSSVARFLQALHHSHSDVLQPSAPSLCLFKLELKQAHDNNIQLQHPAPASSSVAAVFYEVVEKFSRMCGKKAAFKEPQTKQVLCDWCKSDAQESLH